MKRGTARHPKMGRLMALLGIDRAKACGTLELLWHYAGEFAVAGDVGKYTNGEIASALAWEGNADTLVASLVLCRFLDLDSLHRLVIHDLRDHIDQPWRRLLERRGLTPLEGDGKPSRLDADEPWLANGCLARGMGMGMGMGSGEASQPEPPPGRPATIQPEASRELAKSKPVAVAYSQAFERVWLVYPRRPSDLKGDAWKAWRALRVDDDLERVMLDALGRLKTADPQWRKGYQPAMARWLRGRGWEAAVEPEATEERHDGQRAREEQAARVRAQEGWKPEDEPDLAHRLKTGDL